MSKILLFLKPYRKRIVPMVLFLFTQIMGTLYIPTLTADIVNKENALEWLYKKLGMDCTEIACIGDSENDISMLQKAGLRFTVYNALPYLKALPHFVVPRNDKNGVGVAIDRILQTANRGGVIAI